MARTRTEMPYQEVRTGAEGEGTWARIPEAVRSGGQQCREWEFHEQIFAEHSLGCLCCAVPGSAGFSLA